MKKIRLKEVIRKKNSKQKKNIGCVNAFVNITFIGILLVIAILLFLAMRVEKDNEAFRSLLTSSLVAIVIIRVIGFFIQKALNNVFKKNVHIGEVKVRVEKAIITDKKAERVYSYVPASDRHKIVCRLYFENQKETFLLSVGAVTFSKYKIGDEVYIISVNDQYYGDMLFRTNEYELDDDGKKALNEEIFIEI